MHSQHKQKPLTVKQKGIKQKGIKAVARKKPNSLIGKLRNKKIDCPSKMILKIAEPTKKLREGIETSVQLVFNHNHPLYSAHVLSFCPISEDNMYIQRNGITNYFNQDTVQQLHTIIMKQL